MADTQLERLKSFRGFIQEAEQGASVPPVSADDLKLLHNVCIEMTKRYSGKDGVITIDVMARSCNPDANLAAVWLRHSRLRLLIRQGLLAEWQHGTNLDDAVYRVAATIPMNGIQRRSFEYFATRSPTRCMMASLSYARSRLGTKCIFILYRKTIYNKGLMPSWKNGVRSRWRQETPECP